MRNFLLALLCTAISACTQIPAITEIHPYLNDQAFKPAKHEFKPDDVFAIDQTMQNYLEKEVIPKAKKSSLQRALFDALTSTEHLKLDYDSEKTKNAREAFAAKNGNCLSLVILTAALAKHLDVKVHFQDVQVPQLWGRNNNLQFAVNHVNIILGSIRPFYDDPLAGPAKMRSADTRFQDELMLIDFIPTENLRLQRARPIDSDTILAMYFNNRAFELLSSQQVDEAYWAIRAALTIAPSYQTSLNTLGVIYRRHGDLASAEKIFRDLHNSNTSNTIVLSNLVETLNANGKVAEATQFNLLLHRLQKVAPFEYFDQGMLAMARKDYDAARRLFEKEIDLNPEYDESHFWLAIALLKSGHMNLALQEMQLAKKHSTTFSSQQLYSNKVERIKAAIARQTD